ncbi:MAG: serine/threonine protein phosphatase [Lachnospiraceae bacterium]|nr:serine/threonine protein phosphatase [Lachnospiraceae bacterium]
MALYAIADLHLGFKHNKTMEIFGDHWIDYHIKIENHWRRLVKEEDTVIISGDVSWAMNMEDAEPDLAFIENLTGKKVIHSGNHDYWWDSTAKLNRAYKSIFFMKNDFYPCEGIALCGTRGWLCPNEKSFTPHDNKIYLRELGRLKISLDKALSAGFKEIIVSLHYPPTNSKKENSGFIDLIKEYDVKKVIYGHLHGSASYGASFRGEVDGVNYSLVSSDYLDFCPIKIK